MLFVNHSPRVPCHVPIDPTDLATTLRILDSMTELDDKADTALAAPKLAAALFKDFPGLSGETIVVK